MTSIFREAMGEEFDRLHPRVRERFSVGLSSGRACIGRGVMDRVWHAGGWVRPFLALGATRNILLPRRGRDLPFVIENVPYRDGFGREAVTFVRTFDFAGRSERFDATMVLGPEGGIVDYLGTHQHLATDLRLSADADGALVIRSVRHRFREGPVDVGVPQWLGGDALVREWFDDAAGVFRIRVRVTNRRFGPLFGYHGSFTAHYVEAAGHGLRAGLRPVREESRA
jgi:hypothetical protein